MAYDRYDPRRGREGSPYSDYERGRRDERGFFERAGDEVASWFGDEEAERRRREDERMHRGWDRDFERGYGRDLDRDRYAYRGPGRNSERGRFEPEGRGSRPGPSSERYERMGYAGYEHDLAPRGYGVTGIDRGDTPAYVGGYGYTGGYGTGFGNAYGTGNDRGYGTTSGFGRPGEYERGDFERGGYGRSDGPRDRDTDRNYYAWRQRQLDELDRDYDEYRRENQERFESDFGKWRSTRQQKRSLLGNIREHMDVVGSDGETIGKVDCVKGDRIILTKSDSEDNRHHSIACSLIDTIEGDQVRLDIPAEETKSRWRDEEERGFFGREAEEEVNLERSFAGTYR